MEKIEIQLTQEFDLDEFATLIEEVTYPDNIPMLIALIDKKAASWDITLKLIKHFKALEKTYIEEFRKEDHHITKLKPKLII